MNSDKPKIVFALAVFVLGVLLVLASVRNTTPIDPIETPETAAADRDTVYFTNGEELLEILESVEAYNNVRGAFYEYAQKAFPDYSNGNTLVGFEVQDILPDNNGGSIAVTGRYGASRDKIESVITPKKNYVSYVSITNTANNFSIDELLEINSQRNQFIGELPVETDNFVINYLKTRDSFTINAFNSTSAYEEAEIILKEKLSETYETENIIKYGVVEDRYDFGL